MATPNITQVLPQVIQVGSQTTTLKVLGTNFPSQAAILWNGAPVSTTVVDANTLSGTIASSSLAKPATVQLQVQNTQTMQESQSVPVTIADANAALLSGLTISIASLPQGIVGAPYTGNFTVAGGAAPYTWSITSGQLPAGLSLGTNTGIISGTPTSTGNYSFGVKVIDSSASVQTATTTVSSLPVAPAPVTIFPLTINSSIPSATVGSAYSTVLQASGGTAPYTWSITAGGLPNGFSLASTTGILSGNPTASGTINFTAMVTDAGSPALSKSASFSLVVAPATLAITTSALPAGTQSTGYSQTLQATGGTAPYIWSITTGALPSGLNVNPATGIVSGTPSVSGNFSFGVTVNDAASQTATVPVTISLVAAGAPLAISTTSLPGGVPNQNYSATLNATGGKAPYAWTSGSLPAGLTLAASTGIISGKPTASSTTKLTFQVADSSSPAQTTSVTIALVVAPVPIAVTTSSLPSGTVNATYASTLSVTGGTPAYTWSWSIAPGSSSLPPGLTLSATTGTISGTPTTSGTYNFTATVSDNSSPALTSSVTTSILVAAATPPAPGNTWYVRTDGGTRWSTAATTGQCDGLADVSYASTGGTGTDQHCAFNDIRNLWTDGSYCVDSSSSSTCWKWIGAGGDTYIIRGSIATGVSWRIGQSGPNSGDYFGLAGNPYGAGIPTPLSGTASAHTRILGENYGSCSAQSARTQLHGGYGVSSVLTMSGASYVDVACFDITDFSNCGKANQTNGCNTNYPVGDYASTGISWNYTSTNDTVSDVRIHGMAANGMAGPTGDGVVMTDIAIFGNASSGWNADPGDGTTGVGSLLVQNFNISWNGCAEEYPIVDALPYQDCTDDGAGGYGDGFGTTTVSSPPPGWQAHFDNGIVSYNTQDGLDALHLTGTGSSMTITRVLAYGNMGQQIKVGGASGTAINNVIFTNCNAMRQAIPGTPSGYNSKLGDFCRAADTGVEVTVGKGTTLTFDFNTIYSASATGIEIDCDGHAGACDSTTLIDFRNNIFLGFPNNVANGYPGGGTGDYSNPIYLGVSPNPFTNPGSVHSNNVTYHPKSNWTCPSTWLGETNALCMDPNLTDETWHLYGYGNAAPSTNVQVVQGAGAAIPAITIDYTGQTRSNPPSIGAYNQ